MFEALFLFLLLVIVFTGFIAMVKFIIAHAFEICLITMSCMVLAFYFSVVIWLQWLTSLPCRVSPSGWLYRVFFVSVEVWRNV